MRLRATNRIGLSMSRRGLATAPVNTALPVITQTGSVLSVTTGSWTGTAPIAYTYQWSRNGTAVGAPSSAATYSIPPEDLNALFGCIVTATNAAGNASATAATIYVGLLDVLSVQSAGAFTLRRLRRDLRNFINVRRSTDQAETSIGSATVAQTRTNLDPVPAADGDSRTSAGITRQVVGTGTEFGQSYIDIRWNGTATAAVNLRYCPTPLTASPTAASSALVTPGQTYTSSVGYRLVAGTWPAGLTARMTQFFRNGTALVNEANNALPSNPNAVLQRSAVIGVAGAATNNVSNIFQADGLSGFVVDFTMRFYAPNTELGTGNAQPLLQRNTPEVIADVGQLDAVALLNYAGSGSAFITSWRDQSGAVYQNQAINSNNFTAASWIKNNSSIIANASTEGSRVFSKLVENTANTPHYVSPTAVGFTTGIPNTVSVYAKAAERTKIWLQLGNISGSGYTKVIFDLLNGTAATTGAGLIAQIESIGNGVYRCSVKGTSIDYAASVGCVDASNNLNYTGDGVSGVLVSSFQVNQGVLQPYQETAGSPINPPDATQATPANQPRIVNGGAMETENGRPTVVSDGNQWLVSGNAANWTRSTLSGMNNAVLLRRSGTALGAAIGASAVSPNFGYLEMGSQFNGFRLNTRATPSLDTAAVGSFSSLAVVNAIATPTTLNLRVNGTIRSSLSGPTMTPNTPTSGLVLFDRIPLGSSGSNFAGAISEAIIFKDTDVSVANAEILERNQRAYFGTPIA